MDENLTTTDVAEESTGYDESSIVEDDTSSVENPEAAEQGEQEESTEEPAQEQSRPIDVNAIAAAARRKAESELKSIDAEYARRFGHLKNPITGEPIRSQRDYLAALDAQEKMKAEEQLKQNGIDPSVIDNLVANNPAVRQAQAVMAQQQQQATFAQINSDLAELNKLDPSIVSLETVPPDVIRRSMETGLNLVDSFKISNYGKVSSEQQAAIQQQAINQAKGKSHLNPVNGVATPDDGVDIPASELDRWKEAFPDKPMSELKKLYNQTL